VPVISDTAYPRLPATEPGPGELERFTPEAAELAFARQRTRQPGPRLALLVLLKVFQRLGYAVRLADVPPALVAHVAASAGLAGAAPEVAGYDDTSYRVRLLALVRGFMGVASYDREARGMAARACIKAARTRDDLADIVNAGIEELLRRRRELPAFSTLLMLARSARTLVNRGYHRQIAANLASGAGERLAALLLVPTGATRSGWDQVKADPPRPSPQRMREHLAHLAWLRGQAVADEVFKGVPDRKLRQFAAEARALGAADLGRTVESRRLALMAALLRQQVAQALDDTAEMFVRQTTRMHNRAKEALDEHRARQAAETDALVALLRQTVLACQDQEAKPDARLSAVEDLLLPDADAILAVLVHRRWWIRPGPRLCRCCRALHRSGRCRPAAYDRRAERHGRDRSHAAGPPSAAYRRARPNGLAESVRLHDAGASRGSDRPVQAGDRGRAALAHGRPPGDRGGYRRPRAQPHVGAWTPELRPHRLTSNGVGTAASALQVHATRWLRERSGEASGLRLGSVPG